MRLAVFDDSRVGVVRGDDIHDITELVPPEFDSWPEQRLNWLIRNWTRVADRLADPGKFPVVAASSVVLRAANPAPPQLFAIPANYRAHIGEIGAMAITKGGRTAREAGFFLKAAGSVSGAGEPIPLPAGSARRFDHECELGVIIGKQGRNVPRERAMEYVFGFACLIDLTMRIQPGEFEEDRSLRKSFRGFTPLGPHLVTADEIGDLGTLTSRLSVNGEQRQGAVLGDMIVDVAEAIELITSVVDVQPGDVIASGTPKGVGPLVPGDEVAIAIDEIGAMTLTVTEAAAAPRPF
ncbi:fumarylacetoacetate hydrolase family protein [Nocardia miyunensis]|uniref:fumarylacetoacetate hydrolase family protein n=1 Tax=Nocardia miyunensis TaxID=282684 RepID=UPI000831A788|nr:fumarylacetoacetate hydrolase family protein [Nocardia miyunensis]